jgi:hypothetical protein
MPVASLTLKLRAYLKTGDPRSIRCLVPKVPIASRVRRAK